MKTKLLAVCVVLCLMLAACQNNSGVKNFDFYRTKHTWTYKTTKKDNAGNVKLVAYEVNEITAVSDSKSTVKTTKQDSDKKVTGSESIEFVFPVFETITVPAGTFDCQKTDSRTESGLMTTWTERRWNTNVKYVIESDRVKGVIELTELKAKGDATDEMAIYRTLGNTWTTKTIGTSKSTGKTDVGYTRHEITEVDEGGANCQTTNYDESMKEKNSVGFYHNFPKISDERITTPAGDFDCTKSVTDWKTPRAQGRTTIWTDKKWNLEVRREYWDRDDGNYVKELIEVK
ncbi:MAG: hypothetical protein IT462_02695 [Planctomycetes bacterium]|nr:hypothetical protein [Planctomycetota bacterium]